MNVLHVIGQLVPGGSEKMTIQVAAQMRERGQDHRIAVLDVVDQDFVASVGGEGIPIYALRARARRTSAGARRLRALRLIARRHGADILQGHAWRSSAAAGVIARSLGIPAVATLHRIYYPSLEQRVDPLLQRLWTAVVVDSEAVRKVLTQSVGIDGGRVDVIPNFVAPAVFAAGAEPEPRATGITRILMAAHFTPVKGHRFALEAVANLDRKAPGRVHLDLLGEGPLLESCKRMATDLGITRAVTFHGARSDIVGWLRRCDIVLLPSLWEGFGLILAEAMACGKPVVSSAVGGAQEVVVDGETGLLVEPGDVDALASALWRLHGEPDLRRRLGLAGRKRASRLYVTDRVLDMYEQLYARCGRGA